MEMTMYHAYRKKPVVVQAFQMTQAKRLKSRLWPDWLTKAWDKPFLEIGSVSSQEGPRHGDGRLVIRTLEGLMTVDWNDWIIQGVHGELYPCKPDIFDKTYEKAES
jgi:hypothetical protein